MPFEFATATRILFGPGTCSEVAKAVATMGRQALVVTGRNAERNAEDTFRCNPLMVDHALKADALVGKKRRHVWAGKRIREEDNR